MSAVTATGEPRIWLDALDWRIAMLEKASFKVLPKIIVGCKRMSPAGPFAVKPSATTVVCPDMFANLSQLAHSTSESLSQYT